MMKKFYLLLLLLCTYSAFAQIDSKLLVDTWYVADATMKDGSKIFLKPSNHLKNYGFEFRKKSYCLYDLHLLQQGFGVQIPYVLRGNELITSPESSLIIEKLTVDSMIVSQKIHNVDDKDLLRYYLVPLKKVRQEKYEAVKTKDTILATPLLGPFFTKNFNKRSIKTLDATHFVTEGETGEYKFNGTLLFDIEKKKIIPMLKNFDTNFKNSTHQKLQPLLQVKDWNFSNAKGFKYAQIPFSFIHYYTVKNGVESYGDLYTLYTDKYADVFISEEIGLVEISKSDQLFKSAIFEFNKMNYKKAADLFEQSFKANKRNLNAYYNFADLNYALGEVDKACEMYQFLSNEGQKTAQKIFNEKCNKK